MLPFFDIESWTAESLMIATLLFLMLTVVLVVAVILVHAGLFHSIEVRTKEPEVNALTVMYKSGRGAYSQSGSLFTEAHSLLPEYDLVGVYYDDPEKRTADNLRYIVGLVVAEGETEPNAEHVTLMKENGFKQVTFPQKQRDLCAHPFLEVYHNSSKRILFIGPLEQQDCFNVPEVVEDPTYSANEDSCDDDSVVDSSIRQDNDSESESSAVDSKATEEQWEKSASIVDNNDGEESDTNTASSFEEIDAQETKDIPSDEKDE